MGESDVGGLLCSKRMNNKITSTNRKWEFIPEDLAFLMDFVMEIYLKLLLTTFYVLYQTTCTFPQPFDHLGGAKVALRLRIALFATLAPPIW